MKTLAFIRQRLRALGDARIAEHSRGFFKTGPGEYGEGDQFLGIRVPVLRKLAREAREAPEAVAWSLVRSRWHEERLLGLLLLVARFERGTEAERAAIYRGYLEAIPGNVNNWDLVDSSAHAIVGAHLETRGRSDLRDLARSRSLWRRRVAIVATYRFLKRDDFEDTFALADLLLEDREDLIHKAVGWMLREVGKRDRAALEGFLAGRYARMPRTMLRYAIERFPEARRRAYLAGRVKPG